MVLKSKSALESSWILENDRYVILVTLNIF